MTLPADASTPPCSLLARVNDAELAGTAPVARGWVLVEQPGPWGPAALTASGLEPALGASLDAAAGDGVRVQLIRRPGRVRQARTPRRRVVIVAHTGPTPWTELLEVDSDAELYALEPSRAARPTPQGFGRPVPAPLWLVCTHGKRDRCCATYGRPIADALAAAHPGAVWETSHVGGHRFAGNLVSLPGGEVYGALTAADALHVVARHAEGRVELGHLRGRSGLARAEQAAEVLARRHLDVDRNEQITVATSDPAEADGTVTVHLEVAGQRHLAVVAAVETGLTYAQSCDAVDPADPGRYELVALAPEP